MPALDLRSAGVNLEGDRIAPAAEPLTPTEEDRARRAARARLSGLAPGPGRVALVRIEIRGLGFGRAAVRLPRGKRMVILAPPGEVGPELLRERIEAATAGCGRLLVVLFGADHGIGTNWWSLLYPTVMGFLAAPGRTLTTKALLVATLIETVSGKVVWAHRLQETARHRHGVLASRRRLAGEQEGRLLERLMARLLRRMSG